jgi:hypothetical protein
MFSPLPINFIGFPMTFLIDNAAPPLVSPSSFVKITPVIFKNLLNDSFTFIDFQKQQDYCSLLFEETFNIIYNKSKDIK